MQGNNLLYLEFKKQLIATSKKKKKPQTQPYSTVLSPKQKPNKIHFYFYTYYIY